MLNGSFIDDLRDVPGLNDMTRKPKDRGLRVTGEDADGDYDDSGDDLGTKAKAQRETFPCESCQGTGKYRGVRRHQPAVECFACKGRGFFYKSFKDRQAKRVVRAARKQRVKDEGKALFYAEHPGLEAKINKLALWNDFAKEMLMKIDQWGSINDNQIAAIDRSYAKAEARDAQREADRKARTVNAPTVNVDQLQVAFNAATSNGLRRPILRYDGFQVSLAPSHGKNAGALYVKGSDDTYLGKIVGGKYLATSEAQSMGMIERVASAMSNPLEAARAYGKRTGACSCCGRKLTDRTSVANGIGPICQEKFGWGATEAPTTGEIAEALGVTLPLQKAPKMSRVEAIIERRATKYEYTPGMSDADKRKMRAAARKAARTA